MLQTAYFKRRVLAEPALHRPLVHVTRRLVSTMTFEYYPETDTLYIALRPGPSADAAEVAPDYDEQGGVIGLLVEHASERADLGSFSLTNVPALAA